LIALQKELERYKYVKLPEVPTFTGGAIGYVGYDCIQYFEPKTRNTSLADPLKIPEAVFMLVDTLVIYDHVYQTIKVVSHVFSPPSSMSSNAVNLSFVYATAVAKARRVAKQVLGPHTPEPVQLPIELRLESKSNIGKQGYEAHVTKLKKHIIAGDIIQAVPSQRLARPTRLHPFNAYRHLRQVNPSPYMFYLDCGEVQIVGASPETLCKVERSKVYNHAIAGTVRRGKTPEGMEILALSSVVLVTLLSQRMRSSVRNWPILPKIAPSISCLSIWPEMMLTASASPAPSKLRNSWKWRSLVMLSI
jgi:anthranilate synthase component I